MIKQPTGTCSKPVIGYRETPRPTQAETFCYYVPYVIGNANIPLPGATLEQ